MLRMAAAIETDEQMMARYAAGDASAFDALYQRHEMKVWRFLQRSVRNPATADELMQEVWFAVARQVRQYQPTARFTTWLFTIAHHRLIDNHRVAKPGAANPTYGGDNAGDAQQFVLEQVPDAAHREPLQQVLADGSAKALIAAVEQLPNEQREAFLLQAEGEQSVEEIAVTTGVSFETAKSRLRYARARLKVLLQEYA